jgi:hypothetical protein
MAWRLGPTPVADVHAADIGSETWRYSWTIAECSASQDVTPPMILFRSAFEAAIPEKDRRDAHRSINFAGKPATISWSQSAATKLRVRFAVPHRRATRDVTA